MRWSPRRLGARLRAPFGPDASSVRHGLVALAVATATSFVAGVTLGSLQSTLEALPGLLVLVPAAIGMRGNVFGALGSRLGTTIHTGTFGLSRRADTVVGQNMLAALSLSLTTSLALAVLAKGVAIGFGLEGTISIIDFIVVSVAGGMLSSVIVLVITVAVAGGSVRFGWDMDNVAAPLVTAAGDVVTMPALYLATLLLGFRLLSEGIALVAVVATAITIVLSMRSRLPTLRQIVRESAPVLVVAGAVDVLAGLTIEKRLEHFLALPALLVMIPPFLESAGALGGVLSSRLGSRLHLGVLEPSGFPGRVARREFARTFAAALPVFTLSALFVSAAAGVMGLAGPSTLRMVSLNLVAGTMATGATVLIAYYGSITAYRLGLDPDNHGIPMVTSSMDLIGALAVIFSIVLLGIA